MIKHGMIAASLLLLVACSAEPDTPKDVPVTQIAAASLYQSDIAPLFASRCATCHLTGTEAGKMQMTPNEAIASIVGVASEGAKGVKRVVAGRPDESYLIMKLEGTHIEHGGTGTQMPFGAPPLSNEQIAKVRKWISEGAKS